MEGIEVSILDKKTIQKNNKTYYILRVYCSISQVIFDVFVSKKISDDIDLGKIDSGNLIDYCHFKVDSNRVFSISIY